MDWLRIDRHERAHIFGFGSRTEWIAMKFAIRAAIALCLPASLLVAAPASAQFPTTERVSVSTAGTAGNSPSYEASICADGSFVAFESSSTNLVLGLNTAGTTQVYVRDRNTGTTECVSLAATGLAGDNTSLSPALTADGRFVVFYSYAVNLVPGDTNSFSDIFVRDRLNGTIERINLATGGTQANADSFAPSISAADGNFVAYSSGALQLVSGDSNQCSDIFLRNRTTGVTSRVSVDSSGAQSNGPSFAPSISADGRFIAYESNATNLVANDTNSFTDIFVRDRTAATTERVSIATGGAEGNAASDNASISADGRFVAFQSSASNLVAGDTNGVFDVFVRDRLNGTTERVSVATSGAQGDLASDLPAISPDGRYIAFESQATNLVAGDTNGVYDIFVHDRITGSTERVSVSTGGAGGNAASALPTISGDGRFVTFDSDASNLVAGDSNGVTDSFVRDRGVAVPVIYCTAGTTSNGCIASIGASANPSVSLANPCILTVTNVEGQRSGILFYGINNSGFTPVPWGLGSNSLLCVKHPTQRTPIQNSGGTYNACDGTLVLDWNAYQSSNPIALGNPWSVAARVYVQAWFRDSAAVKGTNLSNAVELTYVP
jgi:Tol biopolymer transport system component